MNEQISLVAPSDIAEMAGVSRAAVSNWRKRAEDFPEPAGGTAAKPLFNRAEVEAWLRQTGKSVVSQGMESQVWALLNAARGHLSVHEAGNLILTLACARKLALQFNDSEGVWRRLVDAKPAEVIDELRQLAGECAQHDSRWSELVLEPVVDARGQMPPAEVAAQLVALLARVHEPDLVKIGDFTLERLARAGIREGLDHGFVGSRTAKVLASLAATRKQGVLYDPACGVAAAITGAVEAGLVPTGVAGHDINRDALTRAAQRCFLRDLDADLRLGDVLRQDPDPALKADVIVAEPPFGMRVAHELSIADPRWTFGPPTKSSSETAWLQHVVDHLSEEGRGFVLTPMGTLFRGQDKAVRTELVRHGCVESIIALPPKLLPHVSIALAVWVLRRPTAADRSDVHCIDATGETAPENHIGAWYADLTNGTGIDVPHVTVDVRDILAADADLTPARWIQIPEADPAGLAEAFQENWTDLTRELAAIQGAGGSLRHFAGASNSRVFTVGELIDQGILELRMGGVIPKDVPDDLRHRVVTHATLARHALTDVVDEATVPEGLARHLTGEGDVLVSTQTRIVASVDDSGEHLPAKGIYRLRVRDDKQLSRFYLALVLEGSWNERFQVGTAITRADIRLLEVPMVPIEEQTRVYLADLSVRLVAEHAQKVAAGAAGVRAGMLEALRHNIELPEVSE